MCYICGIRYSNTRRFWVKEAVNTLDKHKQHGDHLWAALTSRHVVHQHTAVESAVVWLRICTVVLLIEKCFLKQMLVVELGAVHAWRNSHCVFLFSVQAFKVQGTMNFIVAQCALHVICI